MVVLLNSLLLLKVLLSSTSLLASVFRTTLALTPLPLPLPSVLWLFSATSLISTRAKVLHLYLPTNGPLSLVTFSAPERFLSTSTPTASELLPPTLSPRSKISRSKASRRSFPTSDIISSTLLEFLPLTSTRPTSFSSARSSTVSRLPLPPPLVLTVPALLTGSTLATLVVALVSPTSTASTLLEVFLTAARPRAPTAPLTPPSTGSTVKPNQSRIFIFHFLITYFLSQIERRFIGVYKRSQSLYIGYSYVSRRSFTGTKSRVLGTDTMVYYGRECIITPEDI